MVKAAIRALDTCYPPDARLRYAAAVLTDKGNIFSASNYGSDTASLLLHGEQMALAHAAMHGEPSIVAIAIVGKGNAQLSITNVAVDEKNSHAHPCGICRQLIWENAVRSGRDITVIMAKPNGSYITKSINDLMPDPWPERRRT